MKIKSQELSMDSILSLPPRPTAATSSPPGSWWAQKEEEAQRRTTGNDQSWVKMEEQGVFGLPARRPVSHAHFSSIDTSQRDLKDKVGMAR